MSRSNQLPNLDKLFRDDDEYDFTPQDSSNLAAIFGTPKKTELSLSLGSQKKTADSTSHQSTNKLDSSSNKANVIIAKAVHAYKLQNGQYTLIGKLGIALTGNPATRTYLLILYRTKQEHISVLTLTSEFSFIITENNYACYYDGNNDNWSILFDSSQSVEEFAREVGVAKYFLCQGKLGDKVFIQDLTPQKKITDESENEIAQENDEIEINYVTLASMNQPLKFNNISPQKMKIKISSDDNWEKSLLGVQKDLKRLMILPPSKQISLGPGYPRERDIVMDIQVTAIIKPEVNNIPSPKLSKLPGSGKASLISRMAKMGQSMLPKLPTSTTTDSEDTEEDIPVKSPRKLKTVVHNEHQTKATEVSAAPAANSNNIDPSNSSIVPASAYPYLWPPTMPPQNYQQFMTALPPQIPQDPNINVFLSETRTHNAEIRMGMSKIADNVQKLIDKFHELEVQNAKSPVNEKSINESLKAILALNNTNLSNPPSNSKNSANILEENIKALEKELNTTKKQLSECLNNIDVIKDEKKQLESENSELRKKIKYLETIYSESKLNLEKSQVDLKNFIAKTELDNKTKEDSLLERRTQLKQVMNRVYQTLMAEFLEDSYATDSIKNILASTIRNITLQVLKEEKDKESSEFEQHSESEAEIASISREEPPPLPPIDPDIKNDWLL